MEITKDLALVLLSGIWVYLVNTFCGHFLVGRARKRYGIPLPNLYECHDADFKLKTPFNNYQRGAMNMVENLAVFYFLLLGGALFNPFHAAICGFVWGFGRAIYAIGYAYAPPKRVIGEFFYFAELYLMYIIVYGCYQVLSK